VKLVKAAVLTAILAFTGGATTADWNKTVVATDAGHRIGSPDAPHQLTEFVSYTCPHCAHFAREGDPVLKLLYIHSGKLAVEIRHTLRDPIDLTTALLTHCGPTNRFVLNHSAFMLSQDKWLLIAERATQVQIARWSVADHAAARRAIASDLGFYKIMEGRGYRITDVDKCLNDETKAKALAKASFDDAQRLGIKGTPSFAIDGKLLDNVHSWDLLKPQIDTILGAGTIN